MKIICSIALDGRSAGSWYAIETARRLAARGHQVLFLSRPSGKTIEAAREAGLRVVEGLDLEEKAPAKMYRNLRRVIGLIGEFGPDAVLAHWGEDHTMWGLAKAMRAPKLALIRVRALDPKPPKRHPLSIWLHRRATDMVVTVNTRLYSAYQSRLRIPPEKLQIIEAGIDEAVWAGGQSGRSGPNGLGGLSGLSGRGALEEFGVPAGKPVVVLLARFSPVKGHRVFLSAMTRIRRQHPGAHFLWLGYPSQYDAAMFKRWFVEGNLLESVTVVDRFIPNVHDVLRECTLGVVSSIGSESVSRSLLEYFACGLPAVATDVGGVADLMGRGDFGIMVRPDDPAALAEAVIALLDDPKRAGWRGAAARDYVREHCGWEERIDAWEELLYRVVSRVRGEDIPRMNAGEPPECEGTVREMLDV